MARKDLTEAEKIKKRWQEYTEELYKKGLNDWDNHGSVVTVLEPDILECKVKWALGSITTSKANGGDRIPAELFQILKDDAVKVLHSNSAVTTASWLSRSLRTFSCSSSVYSCYLFLIFSASVRSLLFCPLLCLSLHEIFPWYLKFS